MQFPHNSFLLVESPWRHDEAMHKLLAMLSIIDLLIKENKSENQQ